MIRVVWSVFDEGGCLARGLNYADAMDLLIEGMRHHRPTWIRRTP